MLPTLKDLNDESAGHCALAIMRCLNTSDLTFMYMLFKPDTLDDLLDVCLDLAQRDSDALTSAEWQEIVSYANDVREYIASQIDKGR